nr:hypothetical protein CFP56_68328 [Quercus suber]
MKYRNMLAAMTLSGQSSGHGRGGPAGAELPVSVIYDGLACICLSFIPLGIDTPPGGSGVCLRTSCLTARCRVYQDDHRFYSISQNMSEEIPKQCKAGVVVNEGPDFRVEVQMVDVPEPSEISPASRSGRSNNLTRLHVRG